MPKPHVGIRASAAAAWRHRAPDSEEASSSTTLALFINGDAAHRPGRAAAALRVLADRARCSKRRACRAGSGD